MRSLDENDEGSKNILNQVNWKTAPARVRLSEAELEKAIEDIDEDGNGQIEIDEYLAWWGDSELSEIEREEAGEELVLEKEEGASDSDEDEMEKQRRNDAAEKLRSIPQRAKRQGTTEDWFSRFDGDGSGEVDFDEFKTAMESSSVPSTSKSQMTMLRKSSLSLIATGIGQSV